MFEVVMATRGANLAPTVREEFTNEVA
jgi:hypothetical protein